MKPSTPTAAHVIIMVGIPGAGKTTFAEHFTKTFQAPFVNVQAIQAATAINDATALVTSNLMLDEIFKTKRTVIYEGPTSTKTDRVELIKKITAAGYSHLLVWVQTESLEAKRRATKKQADNSQLSSDEFNAAIQHFQAPSVTEKPIVISGKHTYNTQLKIVLKHLAGSVRAESTDTPRVRSGRNIIIR